MLPNNRQMPWPITAPTLQAELDTLEATISRWKERFSSEKFCALLENEPDDDARAAVFIQLANELKVVASKAVALAEVLT